MKKIFTILSLSMILMSSAYAQKISSMKNISSSIKVNNAKSILKKSTSSYVMNSDFSLWENDSLLSSTDSIIHFIRPTEWAPVTGYLVSFFMNTPIPLTMSVDANNDTAAVITIDTNQVGTDIATIVTTQAKAVSFSANYKFNGSPSTAAIEVYATKYDTELDSTIIVGVGMASVSENTGNTFQTISAQMYYLDEFTVPDTFIVFASYFEGAIGSEFMVDDIQLSYTTTGINNELSNKVNAYPNPASDYIKLNFDDLNDATAKLEIYSIDGRVLKSIENMESNQIIDISDLNAGMYMFKLHTLEGIVNKKILVK